jgi:putative protease
MTDDPKARPEILAPGGSIEAIGVAVANGADAVYAGVGPLNARARARNLMPDQLAGVASLLHAAGRRLYVTLNLPLRPATVEETARTLVLCRHAGADAVIVRDPVLMEAAAAHFPDLPLHASTQAGVATPAAARRVRDLGCSRVVLARELSRDAIARVRAEVPDVEVEVFVFGAMCFAVSGMCLLGEAISGRSGNHGACSQPCRLPYVDAAGRPVGHFFSMKDLDLFPRLADLVALGVHGLKIEGRLKPPAWVGCVTRWLRRGLDRDPPGLHADEADAFERHLGTIFSRPRTAAWFDGLTDAADLIAADASGHRGLAVPAFEVAQAGEGSVVRFRAPVDLNVRDGLLAWVEARGGRGGTEPVPFAIASMRDRRVRMVVRVREGEEVEVPVAVKGRVARLAVHSSDPVRVEYERDDAGIPAAVSRGEAGRPRFASVTIAADRIEATLRHGRFGHAASVAIASQRARNEGLSAAMAASYFGEAEAAIEPGLFVNPSDLKRARRELLAAFEAAWAATLQADAARVGSWIDARSDRFAPADADLLARGPAAFSRVTGLPAGEVRTPTGHRLEVVPVHGGTRVTFRGKE